MRKIVAIFFILFSLSDLFASPRYLFRAYPLSVIKPTWITEMNMYTDKKDQYESVEFMTGHGYWMVDGNFSVQLFPRPFAIKDATSFYRETEKFFKVFMIKDRQKTLAHLKFSSSKQLKINGYPAFQAISLDKETQPAGVFLSTSIYMDNVIAVVSYMGAYDMKDKRSINKQIPWIEYNRFMRSIK